MSIRTRRPRECADREKLIATAARELAEAEGFEAMSTRLLADQVEYGQPVLHNHFQGTNATVHGLATHTRSGGLPKEEQDRRVELLLARIRCETVGA